jgi:hypothetical protein
MVYESGARSTEAEMTKVLDDALESLRWARLHYHEPDASRSLRELEAKLGYLAQSIIWQTENDTDQAGKALGLAEGRSLREQDAIRRMWEEMWWSH